MHYLFTCKYINSINFLPQLIWWWLSSLHNYRIISRRTKLLTLSRFRNKEQSWETKNRGESVNQLDTTSIAFTFNGWNAKIVSAQVSKGYTRYRRVIYPRHKRWSCLEIKQLLCSASLRFILWSSDSTVENRKDIRFFQIVWHHSNCH